MDLRRRVWSRLINREPYPGFTCPRLIRSGRRDDLQTDLERSTRLRDVCSQSNLVLDVIYLMKYSPWRLEDDLYLICLLRAGGFLGSVNNTRVIILSISLFFPPPKPALVVVGLENISLFALWDYCSLKVFVCTVCVCWYWKIFFSFPTLREDWDRPSLFIVTGCFLTLSTRPVSSSRNKTAACFLEPRDVAWIYLLLYTEYGVHLLMVCCSKFYPSYTTA